MELNQWARRILEAETLEDKIWEPDFFTDLEPGPPILWKEPARPPGMGFSRHSKKDKLPPFQDHEDPDKRALCLHRFAGHELLAVEIMAYTLLAFPQAPKNFRLGLAHTLKEEQGHVRLYMTHMKRLGIQFGDMPLYQHFWKHTRYIHSPLHYVSFMSLTFEMANLDFAPLYGLSFTRAGDTESAHLMATILKDEISHVRFGWKWLRNFKGEGQSEWEAWEKALEDNFLLTPRRAKGFVFNKEPRVDAGISEEWIDKLKNYSTVK